MSDIQVTLGTTRIVATITYVKDALFGAFEYRVWQAGQNKEDAVIRSAQGFSLGSNQYEVKVYETRSVTAGTVWYVEARVRNIDGQPSGWTQAQVTVPRNPVAIDSEGARLGRIGISPDGNPIIDEIPAIQGQRRARELFSGDGSPGGHKGPSGSGDTAAIPAGDVEFGDGADTRRPLKSVLGTGGDGKPEIRDPGGNRMIDLVDRNIAPDAKADGKAVTTLREHSDRAGAGLDALGDVQRGVPLAHVAANVPGISSATGKVKKTVPYDEGGDPEDTAGAQTKANSAQAAAEATAAADATAKANTAEANAITEIGTRGLDSDGDFSGTVDGKAAAEIETETGAQGKANTAQSAAEATARADVTTRGLLPSGQFKGNIGGTPTEAIAAIGEQARARELFSGQGSPSGHRGPAGSGDTPEVRGEDVVIGATPDTRRPLKDFLDTDTDGVPRVQDEVKDEKGRKLSELEDPAGAQSKANAAQAAAEATAAADATTKANTAEANAITEIGTRGLDSDGDFSGTIDSESAVDLKTKLTGIEAGADVTGAHTAADTAAVDGTAAATVKTGAGRAYAALDVNNQVTSQAVTHPITAANRCSIITALTLTGTDNGATAKISWTAFHLCTGDGVLDYVAGEKLGLAFNTTYYIYLTDADLDGAGYTYYATNSWQTLMGQKANVYVGYCKTPVDGGGNTGGTVGGGAGPAE